MSVRIGVVGPGAIAERHVAALAGAGAQVAAVAGPDERQTRAFAERHGIPARYRTADDLYAHPWLDAVVIASPHEHHAAQTIAALRAGLHVLCEIPVALSLADAERVAAVSAETGRHVAVAHTLRFCAPYLKARDLRLDLRHVVARTLMHRQSDHGVDGRPRAWTDDVLWHHGAHTVDAALWLLGADAAAVHGTRGDPWAGSGRPMDAGAVLRVPGGGLATIALSYHARLPARDLTLIAEERTLRLTGGRLLDHDGTVLADGGADMERDGLDRQDRAFLAAVASGRRPECAVADVLPAMRVLHEWGTP
ncbi:Gfo/Idh/MocA family oxidoreductase [Nonomuraea longicatena]|uniref:Gfo/Idh/MocA family oxidoreductase n=1 Tax=Nonomuraea longicatena TaxID=83682 RepID=A0ABN1P9P4_9ACTN